MLIEEKFMTQPCSYHVSDIAVFFCIGVDGHGQTDAQRSSAAMNRLAGRL